MRYGIAALPCLLLLAQVAIAHPLNVYDRHVFFENGAANKCYFHSQAAVVAPSKLEIIDGKLPLDNGRFLSAS